MSIPLFSLAAFFCFLAVALGAFGAHSLKATLEANGTREIWNTAVLYHLAHAIALVVLALHPSSLRLASGLLTAGIVIFSGSLYILAVTNVKWLGAITPVGGLCFLAGWLWLIFSPPESQP
jgi:uncharacterized membrane protein YgdD (TMEM256/DUF423 family)